MAALAVRHNRNVRPGRFRVRHESGEDVVQLDYSKEPLENVTEILKHVVQQQNVTKGRKLAYLNCFVHLICKQGKDKGLGMRTREILCCLRVALFDEAKEVRAATLRVIRHLFDVCDILDGILFLHIDYLIARSLDLSIDNEMERMHALKLIRKICTLHPHRCPTSLLFPLISVGNDGAGERDRLWRACLATICELALLNPEVVSRCRGMSTILRNVLDCHMYPRLNESLVFTILYLLNHPRTRHYIRPNVDLEQLLAPFTDTHFKYSADNPDNPFGERDDRERRFMASKMALTTVMRSWPGLIRLCHPEGSGLQSLVGILYLPFTEIRKSLTETIFDLFRLPIPTWTDDFTDALISIDPGGMREEWKLNEGFVADEGRTILPHLAKTRPNLVENHLSLILSAWIHAGILEALSEVVMSTQGHLNVRVVILLGELLHMANTILPSECSNHSHCLPNLMAMAASFHLPESQRETASVAVNRLVQLHAMKKRRPVPSSLFLDQLLQHAGKLRQYNACHWQLRRDKLCEQYSKKQGLLEESPMFQWVKYVLPEDMITQAVKDSQVLVSKDHASWNWDAIGVVLKWPDEKFRRLEDQNYVRFVRRLVFFFKPTNHMFSHLELNFEHGRKYTEVGCHLITFLVYAASFVHCEEASRQIADLLSDISNCLFEVASKRAAPEGVFGLNSLYNTLCQFYFVFIGHFSTSPHGNRLLEKNGVYQNLLELVTKDTHEVYTKLAISCLNYAQPGCARVVLSKALTAPTESARVYATKFLRVMMRSGLKDFSSWGVEMLVTQLYDPYPSVAMSALNVMDEACDADANLQVFIKIRPALQHHGVKGKMAFARLLSTASGFRQFSAESGVLANELEAWRTSFNMKYVHAVEEMLSEALTTYEKTYHGSFTRRSIQKRPKKNVYLPHHLYGQLTLHEDGFLTLKKEECIADYFRIIQMQQLQTDSDILSLKMALWAVGNLGMSVNGVMWLQDEEVIPEIIRLAEECGVFSIRGTAFYVLGLLASTRKGTDILAGFGWESRCSNHHDKWPIVHEQAYTTCFAADTISLSDVSISSGVRGEMDGRLPSSNQLSFIQEEGKSGGVNLLCSCDKSPCDSHSGSWNPANPVPSRNSVDSRAGLLSNLPKSRTLPLESGDFRRYQSMPHRHPTEGPGSQLPAPRLRAFSDESKPGVSAAPVSRREVKAIPVIAEPSPESSPSKEEEEKDNKFPATFSPTPSRGNALNEDSSPEVCEQSEREQGFTFKIGNSSSLALREERSLSSESSNKSKSRTSSFNTDSTTSGVSSCDSGALAATLAQPSSLSPIPSSTTINTVGLMTPEPRLRLGSAESEPRDLVHPSSTQRRLARLSRVPSLRRRSAMPNFVSFHSSHLETLSAYTTYRDALGYATLRNIKRQRTYSSDENSDMGIGSLFGEVSLSRTVSIESTCSMESNALLHGSLRRNISNSSLPDFDSAGTNQSPSGPRLRLPIPHNRFLGLALPVDINMIFEVIEGEDTRSHPNGRKVSSDVFNTDKLFDMKQGQPGPRKEPGGRSGHDLVLEHSPSACLACTCLQLSPVRPAERDPLDDIPPIDGDEEEVGKQSTQGIRSSRPRGESVNEASSATPGSITGTSTASSDSASKRLSEESVEGRILIRKEMYRLMINMASSVGTKGTEQGLLNLKQRFPVPFQDLCFYSEACRLLASYSFRLLARRFLQELFDELDTSKLLEEPRQLLNLEEDDPQKMAPIRQNSQDSFSEA